MEWLTKPEIWTGLFTLTLLEIVLGVDNIVFISILAGKLPAEQQKRAWNTGLILALIPRLALLAGIGLLVQLTTPLFTLPLLLIEGKPVGLSGKDIVLLFGGLFLIWKSVHEIHEKLEGEEGVVSVKTVASFSAVMGQIMIINLIFSLDSVIHVPKGYTYFAMAFAVVVEMLNLRLRKKGEPVHLHREVV
jgi:predicted tellurium resistance membrane protein TerC